MADWHICVSIQALVKAAQFVHTNPAAFICHIEPERQQCEPFVELGGSETVGQMGTTKRLCGPSKARNK